MFSADNLQGRHAVITGGGSGIGAAIVRTLFAAGADITVMGRRQGLLDTVVSELKGAGKTLPVNCDVSDESSVEQAFAEAARQLGPVHILINCAGVAPAAAFHKLDSTQWKNTFSVNVDGIFYCTKACYPVMRDNQWGRIVNIASTASLRGYAYVSAYCAAKHAVLGLTRALALEAATTGVTVNAVCPGYTHTDIIRNSIDNLIAKTSRTEAEALGEFTRANPQGRLIKPQEVANAVLWLCQPASASITGQAIAVAGGEVM